MKRILFGLIVLSFVCSANAIVVQKVMLKNGSILYGYIQQQDGTGKLVFHTDSALISIDSRCTSIVENSSGSEHMCDIFFQPDSVAYDSEFISFEDRLRDSQKKVANVRLVEKGAWIKYMELASNTYVITWKDIVYIQAFRRQSTALSGIDRICKMKDGQTYEGQYAEETEDLQKLYLSNGIVQSFKFDEAVKTTYHGINPNQDIFAQSELQDVIKTKKAGEIKGVVIEQNYEGTKDADNFFMIQTENNSIMKVKVSDIVELRKEENPKYSPKYDIILKKGDVVVNRRNVSPVNVTEINDFLQLDSISGALAIDRDPDGKTRIVVEYNSETDSNAEEYQLVKVKQVTSKKEDVYGFTYKDLVNTTIRSNNLETSVNHTTKAEFYVEGIGLYALYSAKAKKALPLKIK